jgi:competence protein ComEA
MKKIKLVIIACLLAFSGMVFAGKVNINTADATTLAEELVGVGEKKAQLIIEYRTKNGAFHSADDLAKVKGISTRTIDKNRGNIDL